MQDIKGIILDVDGVIIGEKIGYNSPDPHIDVINKLKELVKTKKEGHFYIGRDVDENGIIDILSYFDNNL